MVRDAAVELGRDLAEDAGRPSVAPEPWSRGTVQALVTGPPARVTVRPRGMADASADTDMPYFDNCIPAVGDLVVYSRIFGSPFVLGVLTPDTWHTVGGAGEPAFAGTWANVGTNRKVGFRLNGYGGVDLCGWALTTAAATAPLTIFTLPVGYRPDAAVNFGRSAGNSGGTQVVCSINITTAGLVQLSSYAGSVQWGNVGLEGVSFSLIGPT